MLLSHVELDRNEHPVDRIERFAAHNEWSFDRDDEDEISISVTGGWTNYNVAFTWLPEYEALHLSCSFNLKIPQPRRIEVLSLISLVNEQLWIGHFDVWPGDGIIMFRHSLLLTGGAELNNRQCEAVLNQAVTTCERYYQAFQFVVWAGRSARESLDTAMIETQGQA